MGNNTAYTDDTFNKALNVVLKYEGGYSNNKNDLGGATFKGITQNTYNAYRKTLKKPFQPVQKMTENELKNIYYKNYWIASNANTIADPKLATLHFDTSVNMGPGKAKEFLNQSNLDYNKYLELRKHKYLEYAYTDINKKIPRFINGKNQAVFSEGWQRRINNIAKDINSAFPNTSSASDTHTTLLKGNVEYNDYRGSGGIQGSLTGGAALSGKSFYDPVTEQINLDPTQRVLGKNGDVASPTKLEGGVSKTDLAASSDPASMNKLYKTPNSEALKDTLYKGVKKVGVDYLKGYLVGRTMELVLGKKATAKVNKYVGHYNTASFVASHVAETAWTAVKNFVTGTAKNAWGAIVKTVFGQAVSNAWKTASAAILETAIGQAIKGLVAKAAAFMTGPIGAAIGIVMFLGSIFRWW